MIYEILWLENKTSKAGKPYKSLSLKKEDGTKVEAVTFSFFPNFANLKPGDSVDGELKANDYQGKTSYTLEAPFRSTSATSATYRGMSNKGAEIKQAQERKSESIAYFNSVNSAITLMGTASLLLTSPLTDQKVQEFIVKWRDWFLSEYDKWNNTPF